MIKKGRIAPKIFALLFCAGAVWAQPGTEGHVNYLEWANSSFDQYTDNPSTATQQWFQTHFNEMVVWSPYFDSRTWWFPNSVFYSDLYAIYQGSWVQYAHPEWIMKDQYGNWLYIPFDCGGGTCPEYAGDIANPAFRAWWISNAQASMASGYKGIYLDDTNMLWRVSDGYYNEIAPIDSNTGQPMTYSAWKGYIAQFTSEIRAAFPYANLLENVIWYADPTVSDPSVWQQVQSSTQLNLERGIASDTGLTGGTGYWSIYNFFSFIDRVHAMGKGVNYLEYGLNPGGQEYGLAGYFLVSNGTDSLGDFTTTPYNWFSGYSVDLGPALGPRTYNNGVYERSFARGMVVLGEPGLGTQNVSLPGWFQRLDGSWVNTVTISGSQGIVLQGANSAPSGSSSGTSGGGTSSGGSSSGSWAGLGGSIQGKAAVGRNADGRLEAFVRGADNGLWHAWQTSAGGAWSGWSSLGGAIQSNPSVVANADGRLEIFVAGMDGGLWHIWQNAAGGSWSGWSSLGGSIQSDPSAVMNADGRLEVLAEGGNSALWDIYESTPGGGWSSWNSLGGSLTSRPTAVKNADGRLEVFARGGDGGLWHVWQNWAGGSWSGWGSLGGSIVGSPAVGMDTDGRLEAFVVGTNGALWDIYQTAADGAWASWTSLGGSVSSNAAVGVDADGRLEVFVRGGDNGLWHVWQTSPGGAWSNWGSLGGGLADEPAAASNSDGRLEVFVRGTDNAVWHTWQSSPNGSWQ